MNRSTQISKQTSRLVAKRTILGLLAPLIVAICCKTASADEGKLLPERLFNGINRPIMIRVVANASQSSTLVLMDADAALLAEPASIRPGRIDLAEYFPLLWELRSTSYLQLIIDLEPIGPALVIQPMLSRMVPVTKLEPVRPGGAITTHIIDWYDELHPPVVEPPEKPIVSNPPKDNNSKTANKEDSKKTEKPAVNYSSDKSTKPERLLSGFRIYPEQDVIMHTSLGDIRLAMRPDQAPNTAWNFLELCAGGFYDGVVFHRVVPMTIAGDPFVIQAGDPTGSGNGGPGYWLPIEPSQLPHDFGVISMARDTPPDSAGSQFFICLSRAGTAALDGSYCAFGYAISGSETIQAIASVELADVSSGRPTDPPVIISATLIDSPPRTPEVGRPDKPLSEISNSVDPRPLRVPR